MPAVPRLHRYYTVLRLPCSVGRRSGSPHVDLPRSVRLFVVGHACIRLRVARWRLLHRLSVTGIYAVERQGPPSLPGHPLRTCCGHNTPPGAPPPRPYRWRRCCLQEIRLPGHPSTNTFRGRYPTAHALAALLLRPPRYRVTRKGSLPTCRAQLWSDRNCTCWMTNLISRRRHLLLFQRTGLAWSLPDLVSWKRLPAF